MSIIPLSFKEHKHLKRSADAYLQFYQKRHLILLRAEEATQAACSMPVVLTPIKESNRWSITGITSFEPNSNLLIEQDQWRAVFMPMQFRTWPFALFEVAQDTLKLGVESEQLQYLENQVNGEQLFNAEGQPTTLQTNIEKALTEQYQSDLQTIMFTNKLLELDLIQEYSINIEYSSGKQHTINGLHTINEDKLNALDQSTYFELKSNGYLLAIFAILVSVHQWNRLIQLNNLQLPNTINSIQMKIVKTHASA